MVKYGRKSRKRSISLWGVCFAVLSGCFFVCLVLWLTGYIPGMEEKQDSPQNTDTVVAEKTGAVWEVHCIDVGQASATLVIAGEHAMLADTGNKDDANMVLTYLKEVGVDSLEYLFLTHPHEDHIGSAAAILREIPVERVLMPDISIDMCETVCYANLLAAIEEKEPVVDYPVAGDTYEMGVFSFTIVCPSPEWVTDEKDLNESSLGIRISDGEHHILLYGDGKQYCENYMVAHQEIEADILIVGHHGSTYSSSQAFLEEVRPQYAVISCGKDNDYGFPHRLALRRLESVGAEIMRTDESGTIVFYFDGKNISF